MSERKILDFVDMEDLREDDPYGLITEGLASDGEFFSSVSAYQ